MRGPPDAMNIEHDRLRKTTVPPMRPEMELRVVLVRAKDDAKVSLQAALAPLKGVTVDKIASLEGLRSALSKDSSQPWLALVDIDPHLPEDLCLVREVRTIADGEHVAVVALTDRAGGALEAIRAGAHDVLSKPIDPEEAREVFARALQSTRPGHWVSSTRGKTIAFMHLSGGVGATTLAVNSACALAKEAKSAGTCLLDFDIQFGSAATLLDLAAASPIQDVIDDPQRLDARMLESMMLRHSSGARVLTAPRTLLPFHAYGAEAVPAIVETATQEFGFVVLDLPVALAGWTDTVLRSADVIYLVTSLTIPSAHRLIKFLELLHEEGMTQLPLRLVANRYQRGHNRGNDVTLSQFERSTGKKADFLIPNDYSLISMSHGQGKPAVLVKPHSPFSLSLMKMLSADLGERTFGRPSQRWFSFGRS